MHPSAMEKGRGNKSKITYRGTSGMRIIGGHQSEDVKHFFHTSYTQCQGIYKYKCIANNQQNCNEGKVFTGSAVTERKHMILLRSLSLIIMFPEMKCDVHNKAGFNYQGGITLLIAIILLVLQHN